MKNSQNYFLISVSNRKNLELCMKYALAGFTNSINGLWTYLDIEEGDYISFLYGARVRNLYKVIKKVAYRNAENLPPWPLLTFRSGNTYYFPFRLFLKQEREFDEPMVRPEFSYVAENLLLRGGYRKTHFQADTITFYNVSEMGKPFDTKTDSLDLEAKETFEPKIVFRREHQKIPEKFCFKELILQSLVRKKIRDLFNEILDHFNINNKHDEFEILGEKALPEGFVDIFIKLKHPAGRNKYILVEVKTSRAQKRDMDQLKNYLEEFNDEAVGGVLIAKDFPKRLPDESKVLPMKYHFSQLNENREYTYKELFNLLNLEVIK